MLRRKFAWFFSTAHNNLLILEDFRKVSCFAVSSIVMNMNILLLFPGNRRRELCVEDVLLHSDAIGLLMKPYAASQELFKAPQYYMSRPDTVTYPPHWALFIAERVKLISEQPGGRTVHWISDSGIKSISFKDIKDLDVFHQSDIKIVLEHLRKS